MMENKKRNKHTEAIPVVLASMGIEITAIRFCAEGEYNANYLVRADRDIIFRINKASQRNDAEQIIYEYKVLKLLADSSHTPKPLSLFHPHMQAESKYGPFKNKIDYTYASKYFPRGFLLMEYIDGLPFAYQDYRDAAKALAHIHRFSSQYSKKLAIDIQDDPITTLLNEGESYLQQKGHPKKRAHKHLLNYIHSIRKQKVTYPDSFFCIVNTELNSGNIIQADKAFIVDWEKAVYSFPYQDIAHFLVPTTTLWKTDFRFSKAQEEDFCRHYLMENPLCTLDSCLATVEQFKHAVLVRALGWCYMAWYQNINEATTSPNLTTMEHYLDNITSFLP